MKGLRAESVILNLVKKFCFLTQHLGSYFLESNKLYLSQGQGHL